MRQNQAHGSESCRQLMTVPGIGPLIASAMVAAIGNGAAFAKGRDFAAWLGLVPKQISTGDRTILGRITKRGNRYLRTMIMHAQSRLDRRTRLQAGDPLDRGNCRPICAIRGRARRSESGRDRRNVHARSKGRPTGNDANSGRVCSCERSGSKRGRRQFGASGRKHHGRLELLAFYQREVDRIAEDCDSNSHAGLRPATIPKMRARCWNFRSSGLVDRHLAY